MLLKEMELYLKEKATLSTQFIITGDFNSLPTSAVYELFTKGTLNGNSWMLEALMSIRDSPRILKISSNRKTGT